MSYGTKADWILFAAARGTVIADDALTDQALVRAQDHIRNTYVINFFPEFDEESEGVEESVYEAAERELTKKGFFTKVYTPAGQKVLTQVDKLKWTPVGDATGSSAAVPTLTSIEARLARYMSNRDSGVFQFGIDSIGGS